MITNNIPILKLIEKYSAIEYFNTNGTVGQPQARYCAAVKGWNTGRYSADIVAPE